MPLPETAGLVTKRNCPATPVLLRLAPLNTPLAIKHHKIRQNNKHLPRKKIAPTRTRTSNTEKSQKETPRCPPLGKGNCLRLNPGRLAFIYGGSYLTYTLTYRQSAVLLGIPPSHWTTTLKFIISSAASWAGLSRDWHVTAALHMHTGLYFFHIL